MNKIKIQNYHKNKTWYKQNGIPVVNIEIKSIAVRPTTRKLKAKWSFDLAADLFGHCPDVEEELTKSLKDAQGE